MKKDNKKALYESIMTSVAREVKKVLNEASVRKITEADIVNLAVAFLCKKPYTINFTLHDLKRYIKNLPNFELYNMKFSKNYNHQDVIDNACDEAYDLNEELKNAIVLRLKSIDEELAEIIENADLFMEVYGFVADILSGKITTIDFDENCDYTTDSDADYDAGMHDYLLDIIEGY